MISIVNYLFEVKEKEDSHKFVAGVGLAGAGAAALGHIVKTGDDVHNALSSDAQAIVAKSIRDAGLVTAAGVGGVLLGHKLLKTLANRKKK